MAPKIAVDLLEQKLNQLETALRPLEEMTEACEKVGKALDDAVISGCKAYLTMTRQMTNERIRFYRDYIAFERRRAG
jgi:hypothetical protein